MKKLILLALVAAGVGVLVKNKSAQLKAGAARVTSDPRVRSALATASERTAPLKEKAAPYADTVWEKAAPVADSVRETVKETVGAAQERLHRGEDPTPPEAAAQDLADEDPFQGGDPLTDPLPPERPAGA